MDKQILTQNHLKTIVSYTPETGIFVRLRSKYRPSTAGKPTGFFDVRGYTRISINHKSYHAHRLAFLYMTGELPEEVDHINHDKHDNRWVNLRAASGKINRRNQTKRKTNTSGFTGVFWYKRDKKWAAFIGHNGGKEMLGKYIDKLDAIEARKAANIKYGYHPNHGK